MLWWVAGFLTYLCPPEVERRLPRGWSEHRRASVRSARGVLRVCVEGNSHSEAEVSNFKHWPSLSYLLVPGAHPEHARQARFCLRRGNQRKISRRSSHKKQQEQIHHR